MSDGATRGLSVPGSTGRAPTFGPSALLTPANGITALRLLATLSGHPVTYTCTPPGSGKRIGVDVKRLV